MGHAERRIRDLLHKADAVDKTEHERVVTALSAAEDRLKGLEAEAARLKPLAEQMEPLQAQIGQLQVIAHGYCQKSTLYALYRASSLSKGYI